jgi:hypothetical protein
MATATATVTEKEKKVKKELTPQQIENRRRQTVTILRFGTLKDPEFWTQPYVDIELFFDNFSGMEKVKNNLALYGKLFQK